MLMFELDNINSLDLNCLINIQKYVDNYNDIKFKINEERKSRDIEYSFSEMSAIIAKVEELTSDIPKEMDEANKFYTIYSRITSMITYDHESVRKQDEQRQQLEDEEFVKALALSEDLRKEYIEKRNEMRRNTSGLYGGLIEGKALCGGYTLILHELLTYVGLKSQIVGGNEVGINGLLGSGHAWHQVQIDGEWYNNDPTVDSYNYQMKGIYQYMLLNDEELNETHSQYCLNRSETEHKCESKFDYSKIKYLSHNQIENDEKDTYR